MTPSGATASLGAQPRGPHFTDREGRTVALRAYGREDAEITVMAFHSLGLNGRSWRPLAYALNERVNVRLLTLDMRGHGQRAHLGPFRFSDYVDDAVRAIQSIGTERLHVIGHSLGGAVAAASVAHIAASSASEDQAMPVRSLAVLASPARGGALFTERAATARCKGMDVMRAQTLSRWFDGATQDAQDRQFAEKSINAMSLDDFACAWDALSEFGGYDDIAGCLPGTLAVAGDADQSTSPQHMAQIGRAFESADRTDQFCQFNMAQSGHMFPLAASEALLSPLLSHWRTHA